MTRAAVNRYSVGTNHGIMARAKMNSRNCSCTTWPDKRAAFLHILHVADRPCQTVALARSLSVKEMPDSPQCGHLNTVKLNLSRKRPDDTQDTNGQFPRSVPDITKHINRPVTGFVTKHETNYSKHGSHSDVYSTASFNARQIGHHPDGNNTGEEPQNCKDYCNCKALKT